MFNPEHSTGKVLILTAPSLINESQSLAIFCLAEAALLRYNCPVQNKRIPDTGSCSTTEYFVERSGNKKKMFSSPVPLSTSTLLHS